MGREPGTGIIYTYSYISVTSFSLGEGLRFETKKTKGPTIQILLHYFMISMGPNSQWMIFLVFRN